MKFFMLFVKKSVPEWFECYYDYQTMKKIIAFCRRAEATKANIIDLFENARNDVREEELRVMNEEFRENPEGYYSKEIMEMVQHANKKFFEYHSFNKRVVFIFCQMKIHELSNRLKKYEVWNDLVNTNTDVFVGLTMNCYAEFKMLLAMTEINLEAYRKIQKKHLKNFSKFELPTPSYRTGRIARTYHEIQSKTNHI